MIAFNPVSSVEKNRIGLCSVQELRQCFLSYQRHCPEMTPFVAPGGCYL
jgi:hypothetical protein